MVKIDLGCHIDGYIAVAAHTIMVGYTSSETEPITGSKADLFHAAYAVSDSPFCLSSILISLLFFFFF